MSYYLDYFLSNTNNVHNDIPGQISGTCYDMCPQMEFELRERERMVHVLEVVKGKRKLIKSYSRSAADSNMAVPQMLRPYNVLEETLHHLINNVLNREDVPITVLYDFVNDRLRSIRQDMTIQRLPARECVSVLEPMIRFYVYFGYKLHGAPVRDYDPVLNKKYTLECIKWFLSCTDTIDRNKNVCNLFSKLDLNKDRDDAHRILVESLYILCNVTDTHPLVRYLSLHEDIKRSPQLKLTYRIGIANMKRDYISVLRLKEKLCPISYCALFLHLPELQRLALKVMSSAYSSKVLTVPSEVVQKWLYFSTEDEALTTCKHYGLETKGNCVRFSKADFKDGALHCLHRNPLKDILSIESIFKK